MKSITCSCKRKLIYHQYKKPTTTIYPVAYELMSLPASTFWKRASRAREKKGDSGLSEVLKVQRVDNILVLCRGFFRQSKLTWGMICSP